MARKNKFTKETSQHLTTGMSAVSKTTPQMAMAKNTQVVSSKIANTSMGLMIQTVSENIQQAQQQALTSTPSTIMAKNTTSTTSGQEKNAQLQREKKREREVVQLFDKLEKERNLSKDLKTQLEVVKLELTANPYKRKRGNDGEPIGQAQSESSEKMLELEAALKELTDKWDELSAQYAELQDTHQLALQAREGDEPEIRSLRELVARLEAENKELAALSEELEQSVEAGAASGEELRSTYDELSAEYDAGRKELEAVKKSVAAGAKREEELQLTYDALSAEHEAAKKELKAAKRSKKKEEERRAEVQSTYNALSAENEANKHALDKVRGELEAAQLEKSKAVEARLGLKKNVSEWDKNVHEWKKNLHGQLAEKDREIETLKARALEAAKQQLRTAEEDRVQATKREETLTEERDEARSENQDLQRELETLRRQATPPSQLAVICVDISGSIDDVGEARQIYRDVLVTLRARHAEAQVAVVVHGGRRGPGNTFASPAPEPISPSTFRIVDDECTPGGEEDYSYCLAEANRLLAASGAADKSVVLIGDDNAKGNVHQIGREIKKLAASRVPAHSIILPNGGSHFGSYTMTHISGQTGGRVMSKDDYVSTF